MVRTILDYLWMCKQIFKWEKVYAYGVGRFQGHLILFLRTDF